VSVSVFVMRLIYVFKRATYLADIYKLGDCFNPLKESATTKLKIFPFLLWMSFYDMGSHFIGKSSKITVFSSSHLQTAYSARRLTSDSPSHYFRHADSGTKRTASLHPSSVSLATHLAP